MHEESKLKLYNSDGHSLIISSPDTEAERITLAQWKTDADGLLLIRPDCVIDTNNRRVDPFLLSRG